MDGQTSSKDVATITTASSSSDTVDTRRRRMLQNILIIWIDSDINKSTKDGQNALAELETVFNDVHIFTQPDAAIDLLTEVNYMKAFLIIETIVSQQLVPLIHDIPQLNSIYIFSGNQSQHEQWTEEWIKIKGIHTDIKPICEVLQLVVKQCNRDSIAMSFISMDQKTSAPNVDQLEPSFMYTQIFKEILLDIEYSQQSVNSFTKYCRENDCGPVSTIDRFENEYSHESAIHWYTFPSFIYSMLNCALRMLEAEAIIIMGFLIRDLHQKIQDLYHKQIGSYYGKPFTVYRGQGLLKADFGKLLKTEGGLISFNNFLSTSKILETALIFAESASENTDTVGILFTMTVDPSVSSTPFASILDDSYFKTEEEILFSMHTVFRMRKICKDNNIYKVDLQLTPDDDQELRTLTERIRQEVVGETGWQRLGTLLLKLNQFNDAEKLYTRLFQESIDQGEKALFYNQFGAAKYHQGDYKKAVEYFEKALDIDQKTLLPNHRDLAISYSNIGALYMSLGEYPKAFAYYEKVLDIDEKTLPENHITLAPSYNNIGLIYKNMGEYSKALLYYEKAFEIWQKTLPANHPNLSTSYNNIGEVYTNMGEHSKALRYYEKALGIWQKSLPANHPFLATSFNNIGEAHRNMNEYSTALLYYEKALKIFEKALPANHPELATSYSNIGVLYMNIGEDSKALSYYEKAFEIDQNTLPENHPNLTTSYNNIGVLYMNMGEYSKALSYYEKAFEIDQNTLPVNHPFLATSFNNIGEAHRNMNEYSTALSYYVKALEIFEKTLPAEHPDLATCCNNIGLVYENMGEYSQAIRYFERSLDIHQRSLPSNHLQLENAKDLIEILKKKT